MSIATPLIAAVGAHVRGLGLRVADATVDMNDFAIEQRAFGQAPGPSGPGCH